MRIAVVGGGPAGLMAADVASLAGAQVTVFDHMPSLGRKFLMAGKSGLNITHTEEEERFLAQYADHRIAGIVRRYGGSDEVRRFMAGLGIDEHVGSSGRVFPAMMKASPLLRAWLRRLEARGVKLQVKHRLAGWDQDHRLRFETPSGPAETRADRVVLAMGGGSWRRLGSDGQWAELFAARGVIPCPFKASNAGLEMGWSEHVRERFAGEPLKNVRMTVGDLVSTGEAVVTKRGLEGGGVYPLAASLEKGGVLTIDLLPGRSEEAIKERLDRQKPSQSLSNRLRKAVGVTGLKTALVREGAGPNDLGSSAALAKRLKALPLEVRGLAPLDEAISTRGGVPWSELSDELELTTIPGAFCAGEMIDWDAPTGGYLLTACLATGWLAGKFAAS